MRLSRVTPNPFENYTYTPGPTFSGQRRSNYQAHGPYGDEWVVVTKFERFGGGKYRKSDYEVGVTWEDVESIIDKLAEAGCPQAIAAKQGMNILEALKELGWQPPQSN